MDIRPGDAWLGDDRFSYMQTESRTVTKSTTAPGAGQQQNAAEFLAACLEPLVEKLVPRHTFIGTRKSNPAAGLKAEKLEEGTQPGECQVRWEGETTQCANFYPP